MFHDEYSQTGGQESSKFRDLHFGALKARENFCDVLLRFPSFYSHGTHLIHSRPASSSSRRKTVAVTVTWIWPWCNCPEIAMVQNRFGTIRDRFTTHFRTYFSCSLGVRGFDPWPNEPCRILLCKKRYCELAFANAFGTPCVAFVGFVFFRTAFAALSRRTITPFALHELKSCRFLVTLVAVQWPFAFLQSEFHKRQCTPNAGLPLIINTQAFAGLSRRDLL